MALLRQETIAGRGRGLVATRPLRAGEVLLRESPLLCYQEAEAAESRAFCSNCFRLLSDRQIVPSTECTTATFCSDSCLESGSHACKGISALKKQQNFSFEEQTLTRFLLAAYNLDSSSFAKLLDLEGQEQDEEVVKKLHAFVVELVPSATLERRGSFWRAMLVIPSGSWRLQNPARREKSGAMRCTSRLLCLTTIACRMLVGSSMWIQGTPTSLCVLCMT